MQASTAFRITSWAEAARRSEDGSLRRGVHPSDAARQGPAERGLRTLLCTLAIWLSCAALGDNRVPAQDVFFGPPPPERMGGHVPELYESVLGAAPTAGNGGRVR